MARSYRDDEIDAIMLDFQQITIENPNFELEIIYELMQQKNPRIQHLKWSSLKNHLGTNLGLTKKYPKAGLERVEAWVRAGFGSAEYKELRKTWSRSAVKLLDGTYLPGATDDVNAALVRCVQRLGRVVTPAQIFEIRCMLGWATTAEIRKAGYVPNTRRGGVLQKQTERQLLLDDYEPEPLEERVTRLEAELQELRETVEELQGRIVHDTAAA